MTRNVGILRNATSLKEALNKLQDWMNYILPCEFNSQLGIELQKILTIAYFLTNSALKRTKSIGVHYRTDENKEEFNSFQHLDVAIKF